MSQRLRSFQSRAKVSGVALKAAEAKFPQNFGSIHVSHGHPITLAHMTGAYRLHPVEELSYAVET